MPYKTCFENKISAYSDTTSSKSYKCYLCHYIIKNNLDSIINHVDSIEHKTKILEAENFRKISLEISSTLPLCRLKKIVRNNITLSVDQTHQTIVNYFCHYCQVIFTSESNLNEHTRSSKHKNLKKNIKPIKLMNVKKPVHLKTKKTIDCKGLLDLEENFITMKGISYFCCEICDCNISGTLNVQQHIQGALHHENLSITKNKVIKSNEENALNDKSDMSSIPFVLINYCKSCQVYLKNNRILQCHIRLHISDIMDLNNYDIITFKKLKKVFIIKCKLCNCFLTDCSELSEHLNTLEHLKNINFFSNLKFKENIEKLDNIKIDDAISKKIVSEINQNISIGYQCTICDVSIMGKTSAVDHAMGKKHKTKIAECDFKKNLNQKFEIGTDDFSYYLCFFCNVFFSNFSELMQHFDTNLHILKMKYFNMIDKSSFVQLATKKGEKVVICTICKITSRNCTNAIEHLRGKKHCKQLELKSSLSYKNETVEVIMGYNNLNFKILFENSIAKYKSSDMRCYRCDFIISSNHDSTIKLHLMQDSNHWTKNELSHDEMQINKEELSSLTEKEFKILVDNGITCRKKKYFCNFCNNEFNTFSNVRDHVNNFDHCAQLYSQANSEKFSLSKIAMEKKIQNLNSCTKIHEMKKNAQVLNDDKKKVCFKEFETNPKELMDLGFSAKNLKPLISTTDKIDGVLNDLINMDLNKRRLPLFARKKSRLPKFNNEMNSFSINIRRHGDNYIRLCIDPGKENIYTLDPKELHLMELGISLSFPYETDQVCLACGYQFINKNQLLLEHLKSEKHLIKLKELIIDDQEFENHRDQYSDLELAKNYMQEESDFFIHCYTCDSKVENDNQHIHSHITSLDHVKKSDQWKKRSESIKKKFYFIIDNVWYYAQVFCCEICGVRFKFEIEFVIHLKNSSHLIKVEKLKNNKLKFDFCHACTSYWFGKSDFYEKHCEDDLHKRFSKNDDFIIPGMTNVAKDFLLEINNKIDTLISESDMVQLQKIKETTLLQDIEDTVESKFPSAKAYTFGSRISFLGFPDSDVDVFLDCGNVYYERTTQKKSENYLITAKQLFDSKQTLWFVEECLLATRVPILKLIHLPTRIKCDVSFTNGLGVEKSSLIRYYNTAYPTCRKMILFLKKWLNLCQLSGSDCITTFAISWYVIFYLQVEGILPTVHDLIRRKNESKIIDVWECGFMEKFTVNSPGSSLKHLHGFFKYYAHFDYKMNVACPLVGKVIKKRVFAYHHQLPEEMNIYKSCYDDPDRENFRFDSPMCIQDPIDLSQNITKAVKKLKLHRFIQCCTESAEKFSLHNL